VRAGFAGLVFRPGLRAALLGLLVASLLWVAPAGALTPYPFATTSRTSMSSRVTESGMPEGICSLAA
jgi:hypothetical protein